MRCPKCRSALQVEAALDGAVSSCKDCGGIFVPLHALETLLLAHTDEDDPDRPGELVSYLRLHGRKIQGERPCPKCGKTMVRKMYPAMGYTSLDFCWPCQSVWFDEGELEKVADSSGGKAGEGGGKGKRKRRRRKGLRVVRELTHEAQKLRHMPIQSRHQRQSARELENFLGAYHKAKHRARARRRKKKGK